MAAVVTRWVRLLWPELVFGALWVALLALTHTFFTDDDSWPHSAVDALQWLVFGGYVLAAATAQGRLSAPLDRAE